MKFGAGVTDKFCHANVSFVKIGSFDCTEGLKYIYTYTFYIC